MDKKALLIADDLELNRALIRDNFNDEYEIFEATDGEECLEVLKAVQIDAMILDIVMPKIDGLEVLRQVRSNSKYDEIVILVVTSTKEKNERMALELGADDVLPRPCDPYVMKNRLKNVIVKKDLERKEDEQTGTSKSDNLFSDKGRQKISKDIEDVRKLIDIVNNNRDNKELVDECMEHAYKRLKELQDILK